MAKNYLGKFQTLEFTTWKGLTKDAHLGSLLQRSRDPNKASSTMVQLLAAQGRAGLEFLLDGLPTKNFDDDSEYYWEVIGSSRKNVPLVEARDENGTVVTEESGMVGAYAQPFYLVFAEDWFANGEWIVGNLNEVYQFRIHGDARMEGSNAVYKVTLEGGNTAGVPAERLLKGERFSIEAAYAESEMSRKMGDVRFAAPVSMRNEFSHVRIQHKVPGNKLDRKLACGIPVKRDGKVVVETKWMHYVDYEVEEQFSDYKNNALAFGKSNRNDNGEYTTIGQSGNVIRTGDGLYAQMEAANTTYYNDFSLKQLEDCLSELANNKLDLNQRHFVVRTGMRGATQFNKAVLREISGWAPFTFNGDQLGVVKKTTSPLHSNALAAGFQFVEYMAPNGIRITLQVDRHYDDDVRNKIKHPQGGPAFSYRYDIMDIGTMDQPNIFKVGVNGKGEFRGYQWGPFRNPFTGATDNMNASFDEDAAVIHKYATLGICVLDPTRTMSLIPSILRG